MEKDHANRSKQLVFSLAKFDDWKIRMQALLCSIHDEMWDVITTGPITVMTVNTQAATQGAGAEQMIPKPKDSYTSEERTRANLDNVARNILYNSLDDSLFPRVRKCKNAMEIWNVLMELGEGDEQEKDNKLTVAMKKFEDFKMLPNETIMDMELRFTRLMGDLTDLGKELTEKERNLKILRGLRKSWEMKVIAMRDNRDMKTTSTSKIFSDLKAYEFEHEPKDAEELETRNVALMANQSASTSNSNTSKSPSKETGERHKRNDKPESSGSRNERRRKAMVVNETSDTAVNESSSSSSSSDDESSEEEKGLLCLFSQESEDLCLMADEDEVNSHSSSCYSAESSSVGSQTSNESVTEMMRRFKVINSTYSKLKEENSQLTISYNALRQVRIENIKLAIAKEQLEKNVLTLKEQCTARERREQELLEVLDQFNNSSNLMDRMINDSRLPGERKGIGFNPSSSSQTCLNKSTNAYSHEGFQATFVQGPTQVSEPVTKVNKRCHTTINKLTERKGCITNCGSSK
ncbi:PREDICTED: uncharacterized protein LOC109160534 [Ipomoea nil]|uniref:uncharacterized protein LOC109160534 n=1 Tax=Ipomoea nil TaxID=35883 RepID=UPI000901FD65|nr:PREDICTED: uncharacterized protein LOC109160534 [Ipomoea nil]